MRHPNHRRLLAFGAVAGLLVGLVVPAARADDLKLNATLGIGGRYRPGTWLPVTVTVVNSGSDPVHGEVQVFNADAGGDANSLFARPVDVAASGPAPQTFQVYTRGLDPDRANVVAQVVSGGERGDGRVLAGVSSLNTTGRSGFAGLAVSDRDLFLVGVSADPSAFNFLNAQKWGLIHSAAGVLPQPPLGTSGRPYTPNGIAQAGVQAVAAAPAELPDKPAGFGGVDAVLLRADAPLDSLTEGQTDALKAWVAAGGHLVVFGSADPTPFSNAFFAGLLPASVGPASPGPGAGGALTPKPLPGVRVVARVGGQPEIVEGPLGAGRVTLVAEDTPTIRSWNASAQAAFWKRVLSPAPSSLLGVTADREEDGGRRPFFYGNPVEQLSDAVMRAPALDAPGAGVVGLFLLAYVLILVPVNYLVLKRLDKKEWAWVTVPALVVVFAVTTYGVGYAAKGSTVFVNRAAIVETCAGERQAGVYSEWGLFSPHRTSYDMAVADPNALAAIPVPSSDYNSPYGRRGQSPAGGAYGRTRFVETAEDARVQDAAVNMWAMRAFDAQSTTDLGGAITSTLTLTPQGQVGGGLVNHTPHALTECHLYVNGQWLTLGDLPPGGAAPPGLTVNGQPQDAPQNGWAQMPALLGRNDKNDPDSDVRQRMRAALHDFVRDLGSDPTGGQYQYYGGNVTPPALFQPRADEAVLTGWCNDDSLAGPALRVDGHPVAQNDVSFIVVHIPLH